MTETESDDYGRVAALARARGSTDEGFEWAEADPEFFDRLFDALTSSRRETALVNPPSTREP